MDHSKNLYKLGSNLTTYVQQSHIYDDERCQMSIVWSNTMACGKDCSWMSHTAKLPLSANYIECNEEKEEIGKKVSDFRPFLG